jgi:hypothetical protein
MHNKTFRCCTKGANKDHITYSRFQIAILILLVANLAITIIRFIFILISNKQVASIDNVAAPEEGTKNQAIFEVTRNNEIPPLTVGPKRLHYQQSVVLPQTALTLVSVLQGIAFGILLVNTPLLPSLTALSWNLLLQQYLYLPYIISVILILLIWQQYVSVILFVLWPQNLYQYGLIFLMALTEILTFRQIGSLSLWLFGFGCIGIIGGVTRLSNLRLFTKGNYEPYPSLELALISDKKTEKRDGILYIGLGIVIIFCGFGYIQLFQYRSIFTWSILISLLVVLLSISIIYNRSLLSYLKLIVEGSDLIVLPNGLLGYKSLHDTSH